MILVWFLFISIAVVCNFCNGMSWYSNNIEIISILIITVVSIVYIFDIVSTVNKKTEYFCMLGGYAFRVALMFWDRYCSHIFKLPNTGFDANAYHEKAQMCMTDYSIMENDTYAQVLGFLYNRFGVARLIGQFFNILLAMTAIFLMIKIIEMMNLKGNAKVIAIQLAAFLPNFCIINSCLLRETVIVFIVTLSLYFFMLWWKKAKVINAFIAMGLSLLGSLFHMGALAPLFGYVICMALYDRKNDLFKFNKKTIAICVVFLFGFAILFSVAGDTIFHKVTKYGSAEAITEHVAEGTGGSGYDITFTTGNATVDMIVNTPLRIFYFIFSPVPWNWRGLNDIIAFVFSALFFGMCYILSWFVLKGKNKNNKSEVILYLLLAIMTAMMFAWGVSNAGTALRHREKFTIQYLILFALCADNLNIENIIDSFMFLRKKNDERKLNKSMKKHKIANR